MKNAQQYLTNITQYIVILTTMKQYFFKKSNLFGLVKYGLMSVKIS